eukprot:CAMPEP_0116550292 /NCGR_PEP_ID=MMETSP0397-20121206/5349_1 /TAXON_ID=216820 /ORGANISM="Cyclophora tenuis, Strain ECT3854" /LENGTH=306 /DNA_ID=CAMNT_0004075113 /DNA_START=11 /DNA_END=934 /DNA_ORIENTATION=-
MADWPDRVLQQTNSTPGDDPFDSGPGTDAAREAYEFVVFVAWYLFLILCCIIPTACAYRRRRMMERRLASQSYIQRMAAHGLHFLGEGFLTPGTESEAMRMDRMRKIKEEIRVTTMTVGLKDLVTKPPAEEDAADDVPRDQAGGGTEQDHDTVTSQTDEEMGVGAGNASSSPMERDPGLAELTAEMEHTALILPSDAPNGNRRVPPACAICLSPYEVGDAVTHSPNEQCKHAFHHECITTWLAKKPESLCPCCRQEFCLLPYTTEASSETNPDSRDDSDDDNDDGGGSVLIGVNTNATTTLASSNL